MAGEAGRRGVGGAGEGTDCSREDAVAVVELEVAEAAVEGGWGWGIDDCGWEEGAAVTAAEEAGGADEEVGMEVAVAPVDAGDCIPTVS